jgi:hypothetical protein
MGLHTPFVLPSDAVLSLAGPAHPGHWRAVHLLSPGCGCSQRVLQHLAARGRLNGLDDDIVLISGPEPPQPDASTNLAAIQSLGLSVRETTADALPASANLYGVPLLLLIAPDGHIAYRGGYGPRGDQDQSLYAEVRRGLHPHPLPLLGCALGRRVRRRIDPFHLKYLQP